MINWAAIVNALTLQSLLMFHSSNQIILEILLGTREMLIGMNYIIIVSAHRSVLENISVINPGVPSLSSLLSSIPYNLLPSFIIGTPGNRRNLTNTQ